MTNEEIIEMAGHREVPPWVMKLVGDAIAKEREACANICETLELPEWPDKVRQPLAQAIRARGQQ